MPAVQRAPEMMSAFDHYRHHDGRGTVYRISPDGRLLDESGAARVGLERRAELSVGVVF
jgi:hypothetical protein